MLPVVVFWLFRLVAAATAVACGKKNQPDVKSKRSERMPMPSSKPANSLAKSTRSHSLPDSKPLSTRSSSSNVEREMKEVKGKTPEQEKPKLEKAANSAMKKTEKSSRPGEAKKDGEPSTIFDEMPPSSSIQGQLPPTVKVDMGTYEHLGPPAPGDEAKQGSNEKDKKPEKSSAGLKSAILLEGDAYKAPPVELRPKKPAEELQEVRRDQAKQLDSVQVVAGAPGFE